MKISVAPKGWSKAAGIFHVGLFVLLTHGFTQGLITTFVGPQQPVSGESAINQAIDFPSDVVPGDFGSVYVVSANHNRVYQIIADGTLAIIAGSTYGFGGDQGPAANGRLASPAGIARDSTGSLYIGDTYNHRIRKISKNGVITTIAGTGTPGFSGDSGPATAAQLSLPTAITLDRNRNIYLADGGNGRVRKIDTNGIISTVAGGGSTRPDVSGIQATSAALSPTGVAVDSLGNLYIASGFVLKVTPDGTMTPLANHTVSFGGRGGSSCSPSGDGGPASAANVCFPNRLAIDQTGNLYLTDGGRIREITTDGLIRTVLGGGTLNAFSIALDFNANLYIAEADTSGLYRSEPSRVRKLTPDGVLTAIVGKTIRGYSGDGGPSTAAQLSGPGPIAVDTSGNLYIADLSNARVRRVSREGIIQTVAGNGIEGFAGDGGPATSAQIRPPLDLFVDSLDNLYILENGTGLVRKVATDGMIATIAGCYGVCASAPNQDGVPAIQVPLFPAQRIAVDTTGTLYIVQNDRIRKVGADGVISTVLTFDRDRYSPIGFALDPAGSFYITSQWIRSCQISKFLPDGSVTVIAGAGPCGLGGNGDGGLATAAQLSTVTGIELDATGNIYLTEPPRVRKISPDGIIRTVAGGIFVPGFSGDGASATSAQFNGTLEIAVDETGNVYISDNGNHRIRKVSPAAAVHSFNIAASGVDYRSTASFAAPIQLGYGNIQPATGSTTPYGLAVFTLRSNGVLVSETAVPASPVRRSGRIYTETTETIRTGIAMVNPNSEDASISFYFTDKDGVNLNVGTTVLPAHQHYAAFLDQAPYRGTNAARSFTFTSSVPVGAVALRGHSNESGEFLMTTLPVVAAPPDLVDSPRSGVIVLPHFASGWGWTTQVLLVNPTDQPLSGTVEMETVQAYTVAPRSSATVVSSNLGSVRTGIIRVRPDSGSGQPVVSSVFTFVSNGIVVTENGIATTGAAMSFRVFTESDRGNRLQTAVAVANTSASNANIQFELLTMDGQPSGNAGSTTIGPNKHTAMFVNEIPGLTALPSTFRGVLRISSSTAISVIGLRTRYNERGDFLISTTPAVADNTAPTTRELIFPHIVSGSGYTTEFILMNAAGATRGTLSLKSQTGTELPLLAP
jgi:sugar lactone lactonase YvrE